MSQTMTRIDRAGIDVDASADAVFAAFRDHYIEWLPPTGMSGRLQQWDFRVGGGYVVELVYAVDAVGKSTANSDVARGRFTEIVEGRRVVQTVDFDSDNAAFRGTMVMTWTFTSANGGAHVVVEARDVPAGITAKDHADGLNATLGNLKRFVERAQR